MAKIAFITEDGATLSQHFGRAPFFMVYDLADQTAAGEQRSKWYHGAQEEPHTHAGHNHGHDHQSMFDVIRDCQVLVVGGMGSPAHQAAVDSGLQVILAREKSIPAALEAYKAGQLESDERRIHVHR